MKERITELYRTIDALKTDPANSTQSSSKRKADMMDDLSEEEIRGKKAKVEERCSRRDDVQEPPGAEFMAKVQAEVDGIYDAASDELRRIANGDDMNLEMKDG